MKPFSSDNFADPDNPTREEFSRWLRADPTRGLAMIACDLEDFAKAKATMKSADRRREQTRLKKEADSIARHMLNHLFDLMESFSDNPLLFKRDPDATPKTMQLCFALLDLARQYLPHVMMPERAKWRGLLSDTDTLANDLLALTKSQITHEPLPPDVLRRVREYEKVAQSDGHGQSRPTRGKDT